MDSYEIEDAEKIIDIGTGGGFPGIPLAIVFPEKKFTLVDSLDKRMKIVQQMADEIGLKNVTTVHGRAEDLGQSKQYREKFDLCVSRAVANLSTLSEYCLPFVKVEGSFIAFKGPDAEEEAMGAENAIMELGGALADIEEAGLFMDDGTDLLADVGHMLVHIDKESKTPKKYPRKAGTPSKNPLK
jgi:16S rRNA (guanine527-N7)-methyltransferase